MKRTIASTRTLSPSQVALLAALLTMALCLLATGFAPQTALAKDVKAVQSISSDGMDATFAYNAKGLIKSAAFTFDSDTAAGSVTAKCAYNTKGKLVKTTFAGDYNGTSSGALSGVATCKYDKQGRLKKETSDITMTGYTVQATQAYEYLGTEKNPYRIVSTTVTSFGIITNTKTSTIDLTYKNGRVVKATDGDTIAKFTYNKKGRLIKAVSGVGTDDATTITYKYKFPNKKTMKMTTTSATAESTRTATMTYRYAKVSATKPAAAKIIQKAFQGAVPTFGQVELVVFN